MPRPRRQSEETTEIVQFRLDRETAEYYRKRAQMNGMSLSEFLRNKITQGLISDSAMEIEERLRNFASSVQSAMPDDVVRSIFMCEAMLSAIVEARNVQELYAAQDVAGKKLADLKNRKT